MLSKKEVDHIANLGRLYVNEDEYEKYGKQLSDILSEIDKINDVDIEGDILIAPTDNQNKYRQDLIGPMLNHEEIFKNAKNVSGDYITVVKVLND